MAEAVKEAAVVGARRQALHAAKRACEAAILAAVNELERATGLEVRRVDLTGQTTTDDGVLTALVSVELVLG